MSEIKDFKCTYDYAVGIDEKIISRLNLTFPDAYLYQESMEKIARAIKEHEGAEFCVLPFCHTVEAEAMGGRVNYGDHMAGPRAKEYICTSMEQILELPEIDYTKGRIHEVLMACKNLREQGEDVVLEVAGPFTVLNVLIDGKYIYKAMRKQPELINRVFDKFKKELLRYIREAVKYGVNVISYADSSGGVNILGPKMAAQTVEAFTYGFLKAAEAEVKGKAIIALCPKTTFSLLGTEKAEFSHVELEEVMTYGKSCISLVGKESFAGQMCLKNIQYILKNKQFKAVHLH